MKYYVAKNQLWTAWATFVRSFQKFFLPRGYLENLEDDVKRCQNLYGAARELTLIYNNSLPDLSAYARPYQFRSLVEFMHLAEEFKELEKERERLRKQPPTGRTLMMAMDDIGGEWSTK